MAGIRLLVTGGTFDKEYDELTGRLFFRDTHVEEMLRRGRARLELVVETVMMIDSLDMDEPGRAAIVERCRAAEERAIVITHGTDTMCETAATLAQASLPDKTIVVDETGARTVTAAVVAAPAKGARGTGGSTAGAAGAGVGGRTGIGGGGGSVGAGGASVSTPPVSSGTVTPPQAGSARVTTPAVNPPSVTTPGVNSQSVSGPSTANIQPLPNAKGSAGAAAKIQADGYKNVQGLSRGSDGMWHGKAMRGNTQVDVSVDARGNVSTR